MAGAAAILAQEHPDWTAGALKDALVSTTKANPALTVFQQGGGRVDVARALGQRVYGSATLDFGRVTTGGAVVERTATYTNGTNAAQTLRLALELRNLDSGATETDGITVTSGEVTVPAGGSAAVPCGPTQRSWAGARTAVGWSRPARTASPYAPGHAHRQWSAAPGHHQAPGHAGSADRLAGVTLFGEQPESDYWGWWPGEGTLQVEEGTYLLTGMVEHGAPLDEQLTEVVEPELTVDRDLTVVLDARRGTPVRIETPKPSEQRATLSYYVHRVLGNGRQIDHGVMSYSTVEQVNVTPTRQVRQGEFEFASRWQLVAPMVDAKISGVSGPLDINLLGTSPAPSGRRKLPLVWAGTGTPAELTRVRARPRCSPAIRLAPRMSRSPRLRPPAPPRCSSSGRRTSPRGRCGARPGTGCRSRRWWWRTTTDSG
ncbi:hypothetical protein NKG94_17760 [Micromonospora sp. M12]